VVLVVKLLESQQVHALVSKSIKRRTSMPLELIELPSYPQDSLLDDLCQAVHNTIVSINKASAFEFVIAGGYVRDWHQGQPANDIDIYLYNSILPTYDDPLDYFLKENSSFNEDFKEALCNRSFIKSFFTRQIFRFDLKHSSRTKHFLDTIFTSGDHPPMRVQFILSPIRGVVNRDSRYNSIDEILSSFDFTHCQFAFSPYQLKAFTTQEALSSLEANKLQLTTRMENDLNRLMDHKIFTPTALFEIENFAKRVLKFTSRGMKVPDIDLVGLIETYCSNVKMESLSPVMIPSAMLGGFEHYDMISYSGLERFTQNDIIKNLTTQWLNTSSIEDVARCMTSPHGIIRSVAEEIASLRLKT
jgi:hypothetical protein